MQKPQWRPQTLQLRARAPPTPSAAPLSQQELEDCAGAVFSKLKTLGGVVEDLVDRTIRIQAQVRELQMVSDTHRLCFGAMADIYTCSVDSGQEESQEAPSSVPEDSQQVEDSQEVEQAQQPELKRARQT